MKILEWIKGVKVGTNGYELEEFEKADGGDVTEKVKQKVLYTGPLATTGGTTPLDAGESFDDWDQVIVYFNLLSDTIIDDQSPLVLNLNLIPGNFYSIYSDTGQMKFLRASSTTFQLTTKTVTAGNISRIIGVKL